MSRTSVSGIYAAGDCTGVLMLASVAAMQGRIAMWHALGEGVAPLRLKTVCSNVFTHPEIATVGYSRGRGGDRAGARADPDDAAGHQRQGQDAGPARRASSRSSSRRLTGIVIGGVVVAPEASELILPIAVAVQNRLTVKDLAYTFSVYPSLSGSITELGRRLMHVSADAYLSLRRTAAR